MREVLRHDEHRGAADQSVTLRSGRHPEESLEILAPGWPKCGTPGVLRDKHPKARPYWGLADWHPCTRPPCQRTSMATRSIAILIACWASQLRAAEIIYLEGEVQEGSVVRARCGAYPSSLTFPRLTQRLSTTNRRTPKPHFGSRLLRRRADLTSDRCQLVLRRETERRVDSDR